MKTLGCLACGIQMTVCTGYSSCLLLFCSGASGIWDPFQHIPLKYVVILGINCGSPGPARVQQVRGA